LRDIWAKWVETRKDEKDQTLVRLKPLSEYRCLFEEPDRFLLIEAKEITEKAHLNAVNLVELIPPQGGATMVQIIQNNVDAVLAQQKKTGRSMLVQVNHPNFQWALTAEDMMPVAGARFFELYNAHGYVNNEGNDLRASTERMWDIVLTKRLAEMQAPVMGQQWVETRKDEKDQTLVRLKPLSEYRCLFEEPDRFLLIKAMNAGDFYCSTGVTLAKIAFENDTLTVRVEPEPGVTYTTRFLGTRRGYDRAGRPVTDAEGNEIRTTRRYSREIGAVLAEAAGTTARYISSRKNASSHVPDECESAWTQPVVVKR